MKDSAGARDANIDLLRILATMMVISLHYFHGSYGGGIANVEMSSFNYYYSQIVETLCIVAVNIFVIISGYFMIDRKNGINIRKAIELYLILVFYSLIGYVVSCCCGQNDYILRDAIKLILFPFLYNRAWFLKTYIMLFLFSPFINKFLIALTRKQYLGLIVLQLLFFSVWPSFFNYPPVSDSGYGIVHFITLYIMAGYIREYEEYMTINKITNRHMRILMCIGGWLLCSAVSYFLRNYGRAWNYDFIFNILGATLLFLAFLNIRVNSNKIITQASIASLGVYIIHTDRFISTILWKNILKCDLFYNSILFPVHMIVSVICVFITTCVIDWIRAKLWNKTIGAFLEKCKIFNIYIEA